MSDQEDRSASRWTPDQPLRADASDEQIESRENWLFCMMENATRISCVSKVAREFAAACVARLLDDDGRLATVRAMAETIRRLEAAAASPNYLQNAACAHLRVTWVTQSTTGGERTGWWQCADCATRFFPSSPSSPVAPAPSNAELFEHAVDWWEQSPCGMVHGWNENGAALWCSIPVGMQYQGSHESTLAFIVRCFLAVPYNALHFKESPAAPAEREQKELDEIIEAWLAERNNPRDEPLRMRVFLAGYRRAAEPPERRMT